MNTKDKVRLVFFALIHIFLCLSAFLYTEGCVQGTDTAGYVDEMYIDGTDFTGIVNLGVFAFNGVLSVFAIIVCIGVMVFWSVVLVIPLRLIALRKCASVSVTELKATLWITAAGAGVALILSAVSLGIDCIVLTAVLLLVPLFFEMFFYLPRLHSRRKASKAVSADNQGTLSLLKNQEDNRMSNEEKNFYKDFVEKETELIVLVKEACMGAACRGDYLTPSVRFVASIDPVTDEYRKEQGILCWILHKNQRENRWGYDFEKMTIYKVRVRKSFDREGVSPVFNNRYLVVEIVDEIPSEPRLDVVRQEYLKPVYIEDEKLGQFTLNREYDWFEGSVNWLEEEVSVLLSADEDNGCTASNAFAALKTMVSDIPGWDKKIREYAAKELTGLANDWNEDDDENTRITEEDFARRIELGSISFDCDGSCEVTFEDDDMFFGHWVVVYIDKDGKLKSANMEG